MSKSVPQHIAGLLAYLSQHDEKANEDLVLTYFRTAFGKAFTRQNEAHGCDGYVPGSFVLELKGESKNWLSGLFQGLAYKNKGLDFSQIVVAAKGFLAIWQVDELPESIREEVLAATGAPNSIGKLLAAKHARDGRQLLEKATWRGDIELLSLFTAQAELAIEKIKSFEKTLQEGRKVRQKITTKNFTAVLAEMKSFFDPHQPVKTVRAFYSMVYSWNDSSTIRLSEKMNDQAALGGEVITNLVSSSRGKFKDFVENRFIYLTKDENIDDFFARYDEALDAVDKDFRIKHGIFFTNRDLSKFVMWLVKQDIPHLGKNYLVIDPACGSGNLVTNWRSPLELRHKVVSEIEPELLFAVERRMKGDQWHNGKFTVVPKVSENKGLNFLDRSAVDYLEEIRKYLAEKGQKPNRPLAFLCNPPYRSDDDQARATGIHYKIHDSISELTGTDASSERYCCFLAQMKLICDAAPSNGFPDDSLLLVFSKSAWLTKRAIFGRVRENMLGTFEDIGGILVTGCEFFDVKGRWPVAFTAWRYKSKGSALNATRSIPLIDLTWMKREHISQIHWDNPEEMEHACQQILANPLSRRVEIGVDRTSIRAWSGKTMLDFKRGKRKIEKDQRVVGCLPLGDRRHSNRKAYGELDGGFIGFMDDLTPCRVKKSIADRPWFRLNSQFMDVKKNRCFSGPPTHWGFCASDLDSAKKLFFWYALARTFIQHPYPMWVDADDMWEPTIPEELERRVFQTAFAIAYAENDCVETRFPANNPITGVPELTVSNPMTPLDDVSFWSTVLRPYCSAGDCSGTKVLVGAVDKLFLNWKRRFYGRTELPIMRKPYLLDDQGLTLRAGIVQINDYAIESDDKGLLTDWREIQKVLKTVKAQFFELLTGKSGLDYFGSRRKAVLAAPVPVQQADTKIRA